MNDELLNSVSGWLVELVDITIPVREATAGYRASLLADGFNETAAEAIAIDFHRLALIGIGMGMTRVEP